MSTNETNPTQDRQVKRADEAITENQFRETAATQQRHEDKKSAHIVYVFDNNYAPIGGVSITSLFENNQDLDEMTVYILTEGFNEENEKKFAQLADMYNRKIVCMNVSEKIKEYKSMGLKPYRGSYVPYLKMFFPDFFPEMDRMIYIDADTVVLRSISPLFKSDAFAADALLGMVKHSVISDTGNVAGYEAPFNSEVMVFNVLRWRTEDWTVKIMDSIRKNGIIVLSADEGILNVACKGEITAIPLEFTFDPIFCAIPQKDLLTVAKNMLYTPEEIASAYDAPAIIHMAIFLGEKPWQLGTIHPAKVYFDEWLEKSLWKDYVRQPVKTTFLYSVEKWMYQHLPKRVFYRIWLFSQKFFVKQELKRLRATNAT